VLSGISSASARASRSIRSSSREVTTAKEGNDECAHNHPEVRSVGERCYP
jgi:hypothetical protein